MSALWNIKVGNYMYKKNISRSRAIKILIMLDGEVSGIKMIQCIEFKEARRSVEAG